MIQSIGVKVSSSPPDWNLARCYSIYWSQSLSGGLAIQSIGVKVFSSGSDSILGRQIQFQRARRDFERRKSNSLLQDLDIPVRSMHADPLPVPDQPGGMLHPHDRRQTVLARDHRAMRHQAPHLRHEALDRDEQWRPAGIRVGSDEDVARFEIGLRDVQDDTRPPFGGP